jgi:hypothetical protein
MAGSPVVESPLEPELVPVSELELEPELVPVSSSEVIPTSSLVEPDPVASSMLVMPIVVVGPAEVPELVSLVSVSGPVPIPPPFGLQPTAPHATATATPTEEIESSKAMGASYARDGTALDPGEATASNYVHGGFHGEPSLLGRHRARSASAIPASPESLT